MLSKNRSIYQIDRNETSDRKDAEVIIYDFCFYEREICGNNAVGN